MNTVLETPRLTRPSRDMADIQHCLAAGICRLCRQPKEEVRRKKHYCLACSDVGKKSGQAQVVQDRQHGLPDPSPFAGTVQCRNYIRGVRCATMFHSPDRRRITRCAKCQARLYCLEETLVSEEARYDVDEPRQGEVYKSQQRKFGRHIVSADFRTLEREEQKMHYQGIACHHLTQAEIAREYTPERIAALLARAQRNRVVGWVPDERCL